MIERKMPMITGGGGSAGGLRSLPIARVAAKMAIPTNAGMRTVMMRNCLLRMF